jgi:hypothetical protein
LKKPACISKSVNCQPDSGINCGGSDEKLLMRNLLIRPTAQNCFEHLAVLNIQSLHLLE